MKLSLVFELLLIFILLAFAASKSVKHHKHNKHHVKKLAVHRNTNNDGDKISDNNINKYCKCVESHCNCCREFKLPVVELNGPGCASLMYLNGDKMSVSLSFGKKVITNRTLSSRKPSPVCMPLPGGLSKFCGRVYNIARAGEEFRACLGLELQSKKTVEAAVRVSCFKFGPRGVTSEAADPLPLVPQDEKKGDEEDDDDDDEDYDAFGLSGGDEDDDDDGDEEDDDDDEEDDGSIDAVNDIGAEDYSGFSLLGEDLLGDLFGSTDSKKPKKKQSIKKQAPTTTTTTTTTTKRPRPQRRPTRKPNTKTTTPRTTRTSTAKTKRPNRRPQHNKKTTRKPTVVATTISNADSNEPSVTALPTAIPATGSTPIVNTVPVDSVPQTAVYENPSILVLAATTPNSVTNFDDSGLQMSLAHITGQLSAMPATPMVAEESKQSIQINTPAQPIYEKVLTITSKPPSTVSLTSSSVESFGDNMVEIVQSLDSYETTPENEQYFLEDSRGHNYHGYSFLQDDYDGLTAPKKPKSQEFQLDDLDVLDLTKIGESVGDQLGLFGKNKKGKGKNPIKGQGNNDHNDDYDDLVDAIGHTLMMRKSDKGNNNKRDRRRQNKMMRGEWSSRSAAS